MLFRSKTWKKNINFYKEASKHGKTFRNVKWPQQYFRQKQILPVTTMANKLFPATTAAGMAAAVKNTKDIVKIEIYKIKLSKHN